MKPHLLRALFVVLTLLLGWSNNSVADAENKAGTSKPPLPADFPEFTVDTSKYRLSYGGSGTESEAFMLFGANQELLWRLPMYSPDSISRVFGDRMIKERYMHMKLLLAEVAAKNGNAEARKFIEETATATDFAITLSRLDVLCSLVTAKNPPGWVFDAIHAALRDTRKVTGMHSEHYHGVLVNGASPPDYVVSDLAGEYTLLLYRLGDAKNPASVPVVIDLVRRKANARGAVYALGAIGDPRAIPVCLELLQRHEKAVKEYGSDFSVPMDDLVPALGELKVKDAVPVLLAKVDSEQNMLYPNSIVEALGKIGDERAIGPLKQIAADEKRNPDQRSAATLALVDLENKDAVPRWIELLQDRSFTQKREVVWKLEQHPDPRAVAMLVDLVKSDTKLGLGKSCIGALSACKYKGAVSGLIECFDVDFSAKWGWGNKGGPSGSVQDVGQALRELTGKDFGVDKAQWSKWWNEEGKNMESLK